MEIRAFKYYGGKSRMVNTINFLIPEHTAYYEPFCGSAAVLLNHPRSSLEVINDMDAEISNFFTVLADREKGAELVQRLCKLWYDKWVFDDALDAKKHNFRGLSDIEKAEKTFVLVTQSFNGTRRSFSKNSFSDTYAYRKHIGVNVTLVHERLAGVRVLNMDGIDVIERIKNHSTAFVFADPPYRKELRGVGADRMYTCELSHRDQVRLLKTIRDAKCKIMLCGYRAEKGTDLYDTYLLPCGWKSYRLADVSKLCQMKTEKDVGHEFIWVNYELPHTARYVISLHDVISF